jgi:MerR family transcriptional regulator, heat shock protein HspR
MSTPRRTRTTRVTVSHNRGVFMISVAAELAEMHPQTLRMYEARGLIEPKRSPKGTRLYSQADVEKLRRIQEMTNELGLNLAGVERVLALEEQLERTTRRLEQLEERSRRMREELETEIERARTGLRGELVPYRRCDVVLARRPEPSAAEGPATADGAPRRRIPVRRVEGRADEGGASEQGGARS